MREIDPSPNTITATTTPAKAGAQLGDVTNEAQSLLTTTSPIGARPPPGWCSGYRVAAWLQGGGVAAWWRVRMRSTLPLVLPRRREPSLDPRLRGETILCRLPDAPDNTPTQSNRLLILPYFSPPLFN